MENKEQNVIGENLKALTFENHLRQMIAESNLPINTVYYILNNITYNIKELYDQQINAEYKEYMEAKNKEESSEEGK